MAEFIGEHWKYGLGALALHAAFAMFLVLAVTVTARKSPPITLAIQAVMVNRDVVGRTQLLEREKREKAAAEAKKRADDEQRAKQEQADREAKDKKAEQDRQAEVQRQHDQAEKELQAQEKRAAEETQRRTAQAEADRKRVVEIQRKQQEEADRKHAADLKAQTARESELKNALAAEESRMQAQSSGLQSEYMALIKQTIERRWRRPLSARSGIECTVRLTQTTGGTVLTVEIGQCNGDEAVRESIRLAVTSASPLPPPSDMRVFDRNLTFVFKPDDPSR
jgi:colicin import membrane protein